MKYKQYKLCDICDVKIGRTPPRNEPKWFCHVEDGIKWVSIKDLGQCNKFIYETSEGITKSGQERFSIPIVKAGTVLLSFKLTIGRVAIATEDLLTNEAIAQLPIIDTSVVDRDYLYYYLSNFKWSQLGNTSSIATAINSKIIKNMIIELPPIDVQKKVANILNSLDELINNNNSINNNLAA